MSNGYLLIDDHYEAGDDGYLIGVFKTEEAILKYVGETYLDHVKPECIIFSEDREVCITRKGKSNEYTEFKYEIITVF
jgi:hypothetical protein